MWTIFDVDPSKFKLLNPQQKLRIIPYIPKYALTKFKPNHYVGFTESVVYGVNSFNQYGDVDAHWGMEQREVEPDRSIRDQFNPSIIQYLLDFQEELNSKGARLFVTYPGYQDLSYTNYSEQVERVAVEYEKNGFITLGYPERYKMPNDMMFDSPYHLTKEGVDHRTRLFIADYKDIISP